MPILNCKIINENNKVITYLLMSFYLFFVFITVITCNDIPISPCDKDNTQIVFYNNTAQQFNCIKCNEGYTTSFDPITKQLQCKQCEEGYVNEGNTISFLSTYHSYLNKEKVNKYITSTCEAKDNEHNEVPCIPFRSDIKGNGIHSGGPVGMNKFVKYTTRLIIHYTSQDGKSTIMFKMKLNYDGRKDMKIYINGVDSGFMYKNENVSFDIEGRYVSVVIEYKRIVRQFSTKIRSITISDIVIKNIKNDNTDCQKCIDGYHSNENKTLCIINNEYYSNLINRGKEESLNLYLMNNKRQITNKCPKGQIFNITEKKCKFCDKNLYTINDKECGTCPPNKWILKTLRYIVDNTKDIFNAKFVIENRYGVIRILFNVFVYDYLPVITVKIDHDKEKVYHTIEGLIEIHKIPIGSHFLQVSYSNVYIKAIEIDNTISGGGYACVDTLEKECPEGEELRKGKCHQCKANTVKFNKGNEFKCEKCPLLTISNSENTHCILKDIIEEYKYRYLYSYIFNNEYRDFSVRPFTNTIDGIKYTFYISIRNPFQYENLCDDFVLFNENTNDFNSFIYAMKTSDGNQLINLGRTIEDVKLSKIKDNKGILIKYTNGDTCKNNKKFDSYLFLRCDKSSYIVPSLQHIKLLNKNDCTFYFEYRSRSFCPICLKREINSTSILYHNHTKVITYKENNDCVIKEMPFKYNNYIVSDDVYLNEEKDKELFEIYTIETNHTMYERTISSYVFKSKITRHARVHEIYGIFVEVALFLLIILTVLLSILCQMKRLANNQQVRSEANPTIEIEMT